MAIPESQLATWSHQGSIAQSSDTYNTIKKVLEDPRAPYADKKYKVFLQGSYGNDTNIYRESDVDIVIRLDSTFYYDLDRMNQDQKDAFKAVYWSSAPYQYDDFKKDVIAHLTERFGSAVKPGKKAVKITGNGTRRNADVIIATQFRRYNRFLLPYDENYDEGICFFNSSGTRIANYPLKHSANCTAKHQGANQWFKPMVRILKNLKTRLVAEGDIAEDTAPSYFIENLLYCVPNEKFGRSFEDSFINSINWILNADRSYFICANGQYYLLRGDSNVTWSPEKCDRFLGAVVKAWEQW